MVDDEDEVLLINSEGTIIRIAAADISKLGRATQGVKIMRADDDVNIISIAKVIREDEHEMDVKLAMKKKAEKKKEKEESEQTKMKL